jgi:acyl-CoA synthetase (AMP-forming)/AMP-acid ligase II
VHAWFYGACGGAPLTAAKVTVAHVVPPIIVALAKHPIVSKYDLSSVKTLFSGAAPLGADTEIAVETRLGVSVKQAYGMTELSPASHICPHPPLNKQGSVGPPLPSTQIAIADPDSLQFLQRGQLGEIWVRGPQVMQGYLNNRAETAKILVGEWLRTGDFGYCDDDGYLFVKDRLKEVFKCNGNQIAPAELEAVLLKHHSISDAAVVPQPHETAGEVPKAFIVVKDGHSLSAADVSVWLAAQVADFKRINQKNIE